MQIYQCQLLNTPNTHTHTNKTHNFWLLIIFQTDLVPMETVCPVQCGNKHQYFDRYAVWREKIWSSKKRVLNSRGVCLQIRSRGRDIGPNANSEREPWMIRFGDEPYRTWTSSCLSFWAEPIDKKMLYEISRIDTNVGKFVLLLLDYLFVLLGTTFEPSNSDSSYQHNSL